MIKIINTWILIKKMCDSVKKRTMREKHMYTYCVLKGIMIMNNK